MQGVSSTKKTTTMSGFSSCGNQFAFRLCITTHNVGFQHRALSPSIRGKIKTSRTGGSLTNGFCSLHGGRNAFTSSFEWSIRLSVLFVIV